MLRIRPAITRGSFESVRNRGSNSSRVVATDTINRSLCADGGKTPKSGPVIVATDTINRSLCADGGKTPKSGPAIIATDTINRSLCADGGKTPKFCHQIA